MRKKGSGRKIEGRGGGGGGSTGKGGGGTSRTRGCSEERRGGKEVASIRVIKRKKKLLSHVFAKKNRSGSKYVFKIVFNKGFLTPSMSL